MMNEFLNYIGVTFDPNNSDDPFFRFRAKTNVLPGINHTEDQLMEILKSSNRRHCNVGQIRVTVPQQHDVGPEFRISPEFRN